MRSTKIQTEGRWYFDFYCQLCDLFDPHMNWYDFTIIEIAFEKDIFTGRYRYDLGLLGFCFSGGYIFDTTFNDMVKQQMDEWDKENSRE